jgi:hypothetical protein
LHLELGQRRSTLREGGRVLEDDRLNCRHKRERGYACCDQRRHENLIYRRENLGLEEEASYNQSQLLSIKSKD